MRLFALFLQWSGRVLVLGVVGLCLTSCETVKPRGVGSEVQRVVFLGDSTTYQGGTATAFDAWLALRYPQRNIEVLNLGLSSETVSGLSEVGHADGRFPRPYLQERLERVLNKTNPDMLIAMYGINCGIYSDFTQDNFEAYKRGVHALHDGAVERDIDIIHITPPIFDDKTGNIPARNYNNGVLKKYSEWLVSQRSLGWNIIDFWSVMNNSLQKIRKKDKTFRYQHDGVHLNRRAYWLLSQTLFHYFGDDSVKGINSLEDMLVSSMDPRHTEVLVTKKMEVLRDAWLSETKHLRPGLKKGLAVHDAEVVAKKLDSQIRALLANRI